MKIVVNAIASTAGGGRTYLWNLIRWLPRIGSHEYVLWVPPQIAGELPELPAGWEVRTSRVAHRGYLGRLFWEQCVLPRRCARDGAAVLLCVGNVAPLRSRAPVVLVSSNALYFSSRFRRELRRRRRYRWLLFHWFKAKMVVWSARAAAVVVTPTRAMGEMLAQACAKPLPRWRVSPFGHHEPAHAGPAAARDGVFRFVVLSYYNYFRNFETVFRAMALLRGKTSRAFQLVLTTELGPGVKLGNYDTTEAWEMLQSLGISDLVEIRGHVPYERLAEMLGSSDVLIAAGYVESFSFTVVEGMAAGVPVLASAIAAHREVGGGAVLYFPPLDPGGLAGKCLQLIEDENLRHDLSARGRARARQFDWRRHFQTLLESIEEVSGA